jgi:hypothetical protein
LDLRLKELDDGDVDADDADDNEGVTVMQLRFLQHIHLPFVLLQKPCSKNEELDLKMFGLMTYLAGTR